VLKGSSLIGSSLGAVLRRFRTINFKARSGTILGMLVLFVVFGQLESQECNKECMQQAIMGIP
jgi:hypothetical protein